MGYVYIIGWDFDVLPVLRVLPSCNMLIINSKTLDAYFNYQVSYLRTMSLTANCKTEPTSPSCRATLYANSVPSDANCHNLTFYVTV